MKFLALSNPFKQGSSSSSSTRTSKGSNGAIHADDTTTTHEQAAHNDLLEQVLIIHSPTHLHPPSPSGSSSPSSPHDLPSPSGSSSNARRISSKSNAIPKKPSRSSLKRAFSVTSLAPPSAVSPTATLSNATAASFPSSPAGTSSQQSISSTPLDQQQQQQQQQPRRARRKSFKDYFSATSSKGIVNGSNHVSQDDQQYVNVSITSSSSIPSPASSNGVAQRLRRLSSSSSFRRSPNSSKRADSSSNTTTTPTIPPVPPLPAHLSPVYRSNATPALHTPSSTMTSSSNSPSSSITTLATPHTGSSTNQPDRHANKDQKQALPPQQLSPLLLGPCLSESLLHGGEEERFQNQPSDGPPRVQNQVMEAAVGKAMPEHESDEDEYGSESVADVASTASDDYGIESNTSHMTYKETERQLPKSEASASTTSLVQPPPERPPRAASRPMTVPMRSLSSSSRSFPNVSLRVDTSLALSPPPLSRGSSSYVTATSSSLSPLDTTFHSPTSLASSVASADNKHANGGGAATSSAIAAARTPSPGGSIQSNAYLQGLVPTPTASTHAINTPLASPRALSQGARICLDYTIWRIKKDASFSNSVAPEKVNMSYNGGRRYPFSTRPLVRDCGTGREDKGEHQQQQQQYYDSLVQRRREPRGVDLRIELTWINIIKKLQSSSSTKKRLTLMQEVELDGFKKFQLLAFTPNSSPSYLQPGFQASSLQDKHISAVGKSVQLLQQARLPGRTGSKLLSGQLQMERENSDGKESMSSGLTHDNTAKQASPSALAMTASSVSFNNTTTTNALNSGAFILAQQKAWRKWLERRSFLDRSEVMLQDGAIMKVDSRMGCLPLTLSISRRVKSWADSANCGTCSKISAQGNIAGDVCEEQQEVDGAAPAILARTSNNNNNSLARTSPVASPSSQPTISPHATVATVSDRREVTPLDIANNSSIQPSVASSRRSTTQDMPALKARRNTAPSSVATMPSSASHDHVQNYKQSASSKTINNSSSKLEANKTATKTSFGSALASKLGFKSKNKALPAPPVSSTEDVEQGKLGNDPEKPTHKAQAQLSSNQIHKADYSSDSPASSLATLARSTPATSSSSASSDRTDVDVSVKTHLAPSPSLPHQPQRPPRESAPIPRSRPGSQYSKLASRPLSTIVSHSQAYSTTIPRPSEHDNPQNGRARVLSSNNTVNAQQNNRLSSYIPLSAQTSSSPGSEGALAPPPTFARARVLSQPTVSTVRPRTLYTSDMSRPAQLTSPQAIRRPVSQLLPDTISPADTRQLQRNSSSSQTVSNTPLYLSTMPVSPPPAERGKTTSRSPTLAQLSGEGEEDDDDEVPLAMMRHRSESNADVKSIDNKEKERAPTPPEARPRLRSALRSASQPARPNSYRSSVYFLPNSPEAEGKENLEPSSLKARLSFYDQSESAIRPAGPPTSPEHPIRSQIQSDQARKEQEESDSKRKRDDRKKWEDHRRRSVYLQDQADAEKKAADEHTRRYSHLFYGPPPGQPQATTISPVSTPGGGAPFVHPAFYAAYQQQHLQQTPPYAQNEYRPPSIVMPHGGMMPIFAPQPVMPFNHFYPGGSPQHTPPATPPRYPSPGRSSPTTRPESTGLPAPPSNRLSMHSDRSRASSPARPQQHHRHSGSSHNPARANRTSYLGPSASLTDLSRLDNSVPLDSHHARHLQHPGLGADRRSASYGDVENSDRKDVSGGYQNMTSAGHFQSHKMENTNLIEVQEHF